MNIDWSKAPEWATKHGFVSYDMIPVWMNNQQYCYVDGRQYERIFSFISREGFLLDQVQNVTHRPDTRLWDGSGQPPAGTVCEMRRTDYVDVDWQRIEFLCAGNKKAFFRDQEGHEWSRPLGELKFRPIRTPEQIAAEERQRAIENLGEWLSENCRIPTPYLWEAAQKIYDAGYRKQVAP